MTDYSKYEFIRIEKSGRLAVVTLNRPEVRNAVNPGMHRELEKIWLDLGEDPDVFAILLTGAGRGFCAGGDIKSMGPHGANAGWSVGSLSSGRKLIENILDVEQPIVAAVNGDAVGLGATLALFCDVIVASEEARFADTHVKVGLVAGDGGAAIWPLLIGPARAKEFLMRGQFISGAQAAAMGLVNYAVPAGEILPKARAIAEELAEGPGRAIRWSKVSVNKWLKQQVNLVMDASLGFEMLTFFTEDHAEAVSAFLEKRKPAYKGR